MDQEKSQENVLAFPKLILSRDMQAIASRTKQNTVVLGIA
jgi:hypothetical protein